MHYKVDPNRENSFNSFTLDIQKIFSQNNNTIHKARNEIKILTHANQKVVVKAFRVPHLLNRIIYTFFRASKAKKSYDNSLKISQFVPQAIGYIEFYKWGLLEKSYFISEHFNYDFTIREPLLDANFPQKKEIFKAFALFTFQLHQNSILHQDYSPGNILIKKTENGFIFKIVDINRMKFKLLSLDERLKNFAKLWAKEEDLKIIIKAYAHISKHDEYYCTQKALYFSQRHKNRKNMKKRLKGKAVVD